MAVYYSCLLRNPFPWLAAVGSLLAFSHSPEFGFLTILLTSSALILCPVIVIRLKPCEHKSTRQQEESHRLSTEAVVPDTSFQENVLLSSARNEFSEKEDTEALPVSSQSESHHASIEDNATKMEQLSKLKNQQKEDRTGGRYLVKASEEALLSDSESVDQTTWSEDSEIDSMFQENLSHSTNSSDGSISDEESLIEIALPTGHYVDSKRSQEQSWYGFQQKWPDCSLESHFRQQNWLDMLNEMNDENFIEIDICMGSIKCSRFEIQA